MGSWGIDGFGFSIYHFSSADDDAILICNMANDLLRALSAHSEELSRSTGIKALALESLIYQSVEKAVGECVCNHRIEISKDDDAFDDFIAPFYFSSYAPLMAYAIINVEEMITFCSKYTSSYWLENLKVKNDDQFLIILRG